MATSVTLTTSDAATTAVTLTANNASTEYTLLTGSRGPAGAVGATGPIGPIGPIGIGSPGAPGPPPWVFVGAYDNGADYAIGDAVTYSGGFYYRTGNPNNPGYPPAPGSINASWTPVADKGDPGDGTTLTAGDGIDITGSVISADSSTGGNGTADAGKLVEFNAEGGASFRSDAESTYAVVADSAEGFGVYATSVNGVGVLGSSTNFNGVLGSSQTSDGIRGITVGTSPSAGVHGDGQFNGFGVYGTSSQSSGVAGVSTNSNGVYAFSNFGAGLKAITQGAYHAYFGNDTGEESFVARLKGAFGWVRGVEGLTARIQAVDTLTAHRIYTLPDNTGTVALINPSSGTQTFSGAQSFSSTTRPTSSGTGTPASNSLVTRADVDESFLDFDTIALRDDFIGGIDADIIVGQLNWERSQTNGTGNWRTMTPITGFGVGALFTAAAFKGAQSLQFDVSNVMGGGGFPLSLFTNSSTRIKFRVQFSSLNARIDIGFRAYIPANNQGFESRKLALNYTPVAAAWTSSTVTVLNQFRRPTVANGRKYYASVGGTTGTTEPTWPLTVAGTVTDGTVTWTEHGFEGRPNLMLIQHAVAGETAGVVVDTGIAAAIDTWYVIEGIWVSGSTWRFTINGASTGITTIGVLNGTMTPYFRIENTDNVANSLSIDYFGLFSRITRP